MRGYIEREIGYDLQETTFLLIYNHDNERNNGHVMNRIICLYRLRIHDLSSMHQKTNYGKQDSISNDIALIISYFLRLQVIKIKVLVTSGAVQT